MTAVDGVLEDALQHSLVDRARMLILRSIAMQSPPRSNALEVGTWRGGSGLIITEAIRSVNPDATVWLCDTFQGVPSISPQDHVQSGDYQVGEHRDCTAQGVRQLLGKHGFPVDVIQGVFPASMEELAPEAGRFGFVHLDCDVYQSVKAGMEYGWPRMVPGAFMVLDDFGFFRTPGVEKAIGEFREAHSNECTIWLTPHRQAVVFKGTAC